MATLPTGGIREIKISEERRQSETESPFTGSRKIYDWGVLNYGVEVTTRPFPMGGSEAQAWLDFFDDCEGMVGTFSMDLSGYLPGRSGVSALNMRLRGPAQEFRNDKDRMIAFRWLARSE